MARRPPTKAKATDPDIDAYIARHPQDVQRLLKQMRAAIRKAAPAAEEKISYGMPTFALRGNLVHFAAFTHHIGFFPTSSGIRAFAKELAAYRTSRGGVQLPFDQPLPLALVGRIVKFRVKENLA